MSGTLNWSSDRPRSAARVLPLAVFAVGFLAAALSAPVVAEPADPAERSEQASNEALRNARSLLSGDKRLRRKSLNWAVRRRDTTMVAPMIYALRYLDPKARADVVEALEKITRKRYGDDWFRWMQWQQANPDIKPFARFDVFVSSVLRRIDTDFESFVYPGIKHDIRLEEVVWGGVAARDGIPPLDHPSMLPAAEADFLDADEPVFGIEINGDARAYPYRFMDWHEMLNDTIGGRPVSLAYCTLCASGILYDTSRQEAPPYSFGSSGLLYRSNKLMFDRATNSLWNQFTGAPVAGRLTGSGIRLSTLPLVTTSWGKWRESHPDTTVVSRETGFVRNYQPGKPYGRYFRDSELMFPTLTDEWALAQKEQVFGLRLTGANKAWALKRFRRGAVINDRVGVLPVVLVGNTSTRDVRAYRRGKHEFSLVDRKDLSTLGSAAGLWKVREDALHGPNGERLSRLPGHLAYWFAWHNYFGAETLAK